MLIGFSINKNNFFSRFIAKFTKSKWSHCFIVIGPIGQDDALIAESSMSGGVKLNLLSKYKNNHYDLDFIDISHACDQADLDHILPLIGHKYGYFQALGYFIAKVLRLNTNPFTDDIICSELVYLFLIETDLKELIEDLKSNEVVPEDLYERLKNG